MLIILGTIASIIIGIVLLKYVFRFEQIGGIFGFMVILLGSLMLPLELGFLFIQPIEIRGEIAEFNSIRQTLTEARSKGESIENTALQLKIIEANREIASLKYYRGTAFRIWIPREVEQLNPIN